MPGAGYDISASLADSASYGFTSSAPVNISFGNSTIRGGANEQTQRLLTDASATNRSPGTTNSFSDLTPEEKNSALQPANNSQQWILIGFVLLALLIIFRR